MWQTPCFCDTTICLYVIITHTDMMRVGQIFDSILIQIYEHITEIDQEI